MGSVFRTCSSRGGIVNEIERIIEGSEEEDIVRTARLDHLPTLMEQTDQLFEEIDKLLDKESESEEKSEMEKSSEKMDKLAEEAKQIGREIKARGEIPTEKIKVKEPDGTLLYGKDSIKKEENRKKSVQILKQELNKV